MFSVSAEIVSFSLGLVIFLVFGTYKTIRDPPMNPYALDIQANTKDMTERPSTWIKGPIFSTCRDLLARSTTMDFMHPLIKMSVKRRAEKRQL